MATTVPAAGRTGLAMPRTVCKTPTADFNDALRLDNRNRENASIHCPVISHHTALLWSSRQINFDLGKCSTLEWLALKLSQTLVPVAGQFSPRTH